MNNNTYRYTVCLVISFTILALTACTIPQYVLAQDEKVVYVIINKILMLFGKGQVPTKTKNGAYDNAIDTGGKANILTGTIPQAPEICKNKIQAHLDRIKKALPEMQSVYMHAQEKTGVPWQVLAAIHSVESSNLVGTSLKNGYPLPQKWSGIPITDPKQDAVLAAQAYLNKVNITRAINTMNNFIVAPNSTEEIAGAIAAYSGWNKGECNISEYTNKFIFDGKLATGVPAGHRTCDISFLGEDHYYAMSCWDEASTAMYFNDGITYNTTDRPRSNVSVRTTSVNANAARVGVLAVLRAMQEDSAFELGSTTTNNNGNGGGFLHSFGAKDIVSQVHSVCGTGSIVGQDGISCLRELQQDSYKAMVDRWAIEIDYMIGERPPGYFQCVGFAQGLSTYFYKQKLKFSDYTAKSAYGAQDDVNFTEVLLTDHPQPGDFIIWTNNSAGHIAFIDSVSSDGTIIQVAEANAAIAGSVRMHNYSLTAARDDSDTNTKLGFIRKIR